MKKYFSITLLVAFTFSDVAAQASKILKLLSPDKKTELLINTAAQLSWSATRQSNSIIASSAIGMTLSTGEVLGSAPKIISSKIIAVNKTFKTPFYKKQSVADIYNELTISFKGNYSILFRAYDDGVAYRFIVSKKGAYEVMSEQTEFNFDKDVETLVPYVWDFRGNDQYIQSFEALYKKEPVSAVKKDTVGFLPVLANLGTNKAVILEAELEDYPGMYLKGNDNKGFSATFAAYPLTYFQGGYNKLNQMVSERAAYIAKVNGPRSFPWRVVVISDKDADLANNDMVQKLATPSRIKEESWIVPGKVAWDWWNDWNISQVDFEAGINTQTYKYYIDFAAANKLEYIVMDEGWSNSLDMMQLSDKIDLQQLVDYATQKNVGIILWASWYAVDQKMEAAFSKYAAMGIKGFKIDFMDRDDQPMVASIYAIAKKAAEHKLLIDYHGVYKPTGLQRTYPNVLNFEGVKGMENVKWTPADDMPGYELIVPFVRMVAGPMDYTPGAMRNATKEGFKPSRSMPVSQGTRCHQLAMYVVYEAPLQMLADNPTAYMKEQECTDFISAIPTVFDETIALDGQVGEHIAIARKKDDVWYVAGMTNWTARKLYIDFSFLGEGNFEATIFKDGINATKDPSDYKKEVKAISSKDKLEFQLHPGGGYAMMIRKIK